ncbi:hypothetical protein [Clostridium perfringens]|uniref:hypothetical protein n=1 Tax=Clostridium perfringens TaxID=1502 RepID=UPI000776834A|nr:hypothetical protein [Clostridium perfringens]AMN31773.1 hypothetical protein JFP55_02160 [Clostridium perfringens]
MDKLFLFINQLEKYKANVTQKGDIIEFSLNYDKKLDSLISYNNILELNNLYPNTINLYIKNSCTEEIDLIDYIDDQDDFEGELKRLKPESSLLIIIKFNEFINIFLKDYKSKITLYYSEREFLNKFNTTVDYVDIEEIFFKSDKNIVIIIKSELYLYNDKLLITNFQREDLKEEIKNFLNNAIEDTSKAIQLRNTSCNWIGAPSKITPVDLYMDFDNEDFLLSDNLKRILIELNCKLIIIFFSNFTSNVEGKYISTINGNKRIEIDDFENSSYYTENSYRELITIYEWIYKDGSIDKLSICRNLISVLISAKCQGSKLKTILDNTDLLLKSLHDNLEAYASENVNNYFKERNTLKKEISKDVNSINSQIDNIIKLLLTNFTSLIGISIAGVVGYIAKGDIFFIKILSILYVVQLNINCILNIPIYIIRSFEFHNDFNAKVKEYKELYFDDAALKKFKKRKKKNTIILFVYFIIIFLIIVIINFLEYKLLFDVEFIKSILLRFN